MPKKTASHSPSFPVPEALSSTRPPEDQTHLWFLENLDQINRAIQGTTDLTQVMTDALDVLLDIFACDRAWLTYPCDPEAATWQVPMERTRPEYPGMLPIGVDFPLDPVRTEVYRILRTHSGPVQFSPTAIHPLTAAMEENFQAKSFIAMAFYPKIGKPWSFGLHQCTHGRVWTPEEERLLQEIGRRLEDALTSLLAYRNLQNSEHKLEEAQHLAKVGYWERDLTAGIVTLSSESCRIFGFPPQEMTFDLGTWHTQWQKLIYPEDREFVIEALTEALQDGKPYNVEYQVLLPSGETRFVHCQGDIIKDELGWPTRMFGMIQNITDRKRAEQALRESEERYRIVADNTFDWEFWLSPTEHFIYNSPSCQYITGYTAAQFIHEPTFLQHIVHPDDREAFQRHREHVLSHQVPGEIEFRLLHADGSIRHIAHVCQPVIDENGKYLGKRGSNRDITSRKEAEENLRKLSHTIEQSPASIIITDATGRIEYVNPHFTQVTGYTREEVIGKSPRLLSSGETGRVVYAQIWHTIQDRRVWFGEFHNKKKNKELYWVSASISPVLDTQGKIEHFVAVEEDITARKEAEEAIRRHVRELEALNRISVALRKALTVEETLPILLTETLAALDTEAGVIWLYHPANDELHATVARGWFEHLHERPLKPGEGIAGYVFAIGQVYTSPEFTYDTRTSPPLREQVPPGWGGACLPLRSATSTVGVLFVSVPLPRQITSEEVKLLESLTEMAGNALHRMRLHEESLHRIQQLQALRTIDRVINASLDIEVSLTILLEQTMTQLETDAADVLILSPYTQILEYAAGRGFLTASSDRSRIRLGQGCAGLATLDRRTIWVTGADEIQKAFPRGGLLGDESFLAFACAPLITKGQVLGVLEVFFRRPFQPNEEWINYLEILAGQAAIAIESVRSFERLQRSNAELILAYDTTIEGWSRALDLRDRETEGHTQRVTELTMRLARAAGMTEEELVHVRRGALLHDIGKMGVPDAILFKPEGLTQEEQAIMHQHPHYAFEMLSPIIYLKPALDIPYCHHEKWDGSGYPRGLKGEQIPLAARLFSVVDVWDALCSDRPYRKAWTEDEVLIHIRALSGSHFDPYAVELFLEVIESDNAKNRKTLE